MVAIGWGWMEKKECRITENTVIDICVFHDRSCIVPFTVYDEGDPYKRGQDKDIVK
jgi:hypothetical protein